MTSPITLSDNIYQQGFHIIDDFLDLDIYRALCDVLETTNNQGNFKKANIGQNQQKTHNPTIRSDQIFWLDKQEGNHPINDFFSAIENIRISLNQSLFLGLMDYEAHFAIYQPNSFYKKHVDQFSTTQDRRISCVYYLNEDWQEAFAGELILYDTSDQLLTKIQPQGNRLVCFSSDMPHEVSTTFQTRYSIAAWLKIRPLTS